MADILIDTQTAPTAPASGKAIIFVDSTSKRINTMADDGTIRGRLANNDATASQGAGFAADTYVTNSGLLIPSFGMKPGMLFKWVITASKTAAGVATPIYQIRIGSNQSTADTSRLSLTAGAQTAAADNGILFVVVQVRSVSATGVIAGAAAWAKTQPGTAGLGGSIDGVSSTFDNTTAAGLYVGLSINGGASAAWTITACAADLFS